MKEIREKLTSRSIIIALILITSETMKYCYLINVFERLLLHAQVYQSIMSLITLVVFLVCICYVELIYHKNNNLIFKPSSYRNNTFFNKIVKHNLIIHVVMTAVLFLIPNEVKYNYTILVIAVLVIEFLRPDVLRVKEERKENPENVNIDVDADIQQLASENIEDDVDGDEYYEISGNAYYYKILEEAKNRNIAVYRKLLIRRGIMGSPEAYIACAEDEDSLPERMKRQLRREKIRYAKIIDCVGRDCLVPGKIFNSDDEALQFLHDMNKSDNPVGTPSDVEYFWKNYGKYYYNRPSIADR
ncbi:hypothetical protein [Gardnerella vaginalis]|uniref:hypothetical protein n=1 Tax=Gardnerella vaginalis TaxID=2702 RepID=UPI0039EFAD25